MWALLFFVGLILFGLEWFVFPGTLALGIAGGVLMFVSVVMALVDLYPTAPSVPGSTWSWSWGRLTVQDFNRALLTLVITIVGFAAGVFGLSHYLPRTAFYGALVGRGASGASADAALASNRSTLLGQEGIAVSMLRPGGKVDLGDRMIDVVTEGQMIDKGTRVRVIGFSGPEAIVTAV
jgi:membrane-bound serine protease (ClpP class)